jgi:hypothetical protein
MNLLEKFSEFVGLGYGRKSILQRHCREQLELADKIPKQEVSVIVDLTQAIGVPTFFPTTAGITTGTTGAWVDMGMGEILTNCIIQIGTVTGTTPSLTAQLEESTTTGAAGTLIAGLTTFNVTTSSQEFILIGQRTKRYCRLNITTVTGTTPLFVVSATLKSQNKSSGTPAGGFSRSPNT